MALAISGFAMVSLIGLVSVGLDQSRKTIEISAEGQILDWTKSYAKSLMETEGVTALASSTPLYFDSDGLALEGAAASNTEKRIFSATISPVNKALPGSSQALWGVEIVIKSPARNNQLLGNHAFWFSK